jgi:hypothetical protein
MLEGGWKMVRLAAYEHAAKAILPERRSAKEANP